LEELLRLPEEPEPSPALEFMRRREALLISYSVFVGNYRELTERLKLVENPHVAINLWTVKLDVEFEKVRDEVTRLLHNFLASALSLLDHIKVHMEKLYEGSDLFAEYTSRRREHVFSTPVYRFVYDLRQYAIHNKLPLVGRIFSFHKTRGIRISYFLDVGELKRSKKKRWSAEARQYMDTYGGQLPLRQLAMEYFPVMNEFYKWLRKREPEFNRENPNFLRQRWERIAKQMRTTGPDYDKRGA